MTTTPNDVPGISAPSSATSPADTTEITTRSVGPVAVATAALTTLALLWAYYIDSPWKAMPKDWGIADDQGVAGLIWIAVFVSLSMAIVFGLVVRSALSREPARTARTAMILALVGVPLTFVGFWTGLPLVMGCAATFLALDARGRLGRTPVTAAVAMVLGVLIAVGTLVLCITG